MASPSWLNPGPPKPSKVQEKTYGRLLVKIVNAHPVQKGDTSAIHGTVGLLSEEGREYASPIASNETVVFYYVRKSKPATAPQLDFQLYAGAQAVIPHRFRRRGVNSPPSRGDDMVMSPASPARFLGEGTLALVKEWPRKGVLDKEGACVEAVDVCVDGVPTYSLDVSLEFRPDRSRDAAEMDDDSVGNGANVGADAILLSPDARLPSQASWSTPALGKADGSSRRIADAAGDGSPSWTIAEDANDRAEKGANRGLVVYSPPPSGASPAAMKMAEIEKKGPLSDAEYRIFVLYDRGNKGYLTVEEFKMFLKDMNSSGFSAENLARADKGICGLVVSLPGEPLGMYLVHNHSIFSVCYGNGNDKMVTSLPDRLFLVIIIFLYSASLTCAMAQFFPQVPYVYRVVGQSIIDAFGLTLITTLYSLSHRKACPDCGRYLGDALLSMVFIFLLSLLWIRAQKLDAAVETLRTLLPNWLAGRFTEVFKVAASWGFRVQYGSTQGVL